MWFIPNIIQKLTFPAAPKSPWIDDHKRFNIKSLCGHLRFLIRGVLARRKCQFLIHVRYFVIVVILALSFHCHATQDQLEAAIDAKDYIQAIVLQREQVSKADINDKAEELKNLAIIYLKDQQQEKAFDTFLLSLDAIKTQSIQVTQKDEDLYKQALAVYLDHKGQTPQKIASDIIKEYAPLLKLHSQDYQLAYLIALAYANKSQYDEFFNLFFDAYKYYPDHFLAYKTKAVLHIKLMERKRSEDDRKLQREAVLLNLNKALELNPQDVTLYKLLITFSFPHLKAEQVRLCLNKIMEENMIIPRSDVLFYVQQAIEVKDKALAQRFIDRAREWYQQSRIITAAQSYIDTHN